MHMKKEMQAGASRMGEDDRHMEVRHMLREQLPKREI